ncbi:MAG: outer membrane protein transport protein, partial [Bacteroidia bacterium]|nr:outer membrane protein transport protein [Bacteroidia bacterium]
MIYLKQFLKLILIVSCQLSIVNCTAGGFQVNLQGQRQTGMGHTGTGFVTDAATIFFNPGGMGWLDTSVNISAGISFILPRTQYLESFPGTHNARMVHNVGTPFEFYYSAALRKNIRAGIGVYTPFGSRAQWSDDWKGQFIIREINLKTIFIQPTLSWKVNEHLGIGAGFVICTGSFSLRKGIPVQNSASEYGEANLQGDASGIGANIGAFFSFNEKWSGGISYRTLVKAKVDRGEAKFTVPGYLQQYFPSTNFSAALNLPQVLSVGIGYKLNSKLSLAADVNFIGWSSYDTLQINFEQNTEKLTNISSARKYKDVLIYRIGAEYLLCKNVFVRTGVYYDSTPVQNGYLTPETPDAEKSVITTGLSYRVT